MLCKACGEGGDLQVCLGCGHGFCAAHCTDSGGAPMCAACADEEAERANKHAARVASGEVAVAKPPPQLPTKAKPEPQDGKQGRKGGVILMVLGGGASVIGIAIMAVVSQNLDPDADTYIPKIAALPIAAAFVAFYVGLIQTVFGGELMKKIRSEDEEEMSCLQLAVIIIPFLALLMGLMPLMAMFAK